MKPGAFEWVRALTTRTQYGLVALIALVGYEGCSRIGDVADARGSDHRLVRSQFHGLNDGFSDDVWTARLAEARPLVEAWRVLSWRDATPGVIAANIRSALAARADAAGLVFSRIQVEPDPLAIAGGEGLRFEFTGRAPETGAFAVFVGAIAAHEPALIMTTVTFQSSPRSGVEFTIGGIAPFETASLAPDDPPGDSAVSPTEDKGALARSEGAR